MLYWENEFGKLYLGKAEDILPTLEPNSVDMVVTSPPYWMARKYLSDDELGQEPDYRVYIDNLCKILDCTKYVLKDTGNLFVNIGDKYFSKNVGTGGKTEKQLTNAGSFFEQKKKIVPLMQQGSLMNLPNRFAIQLVDEYYFILKHTLIWHKSNAFPTSNKKKFTLDFEYLFHFVLDIDNYYFEQQFEPSTQATQDQYRNLLREDVDNLKAPYKNNAPRASRKYKHDLVSITGQPSPNRMWEDTESLKRQLERGRNKRSVWTIPIGTERGTTNHIATYPRELIKTPILACSPEKFGVVLDPFMGSGTTALMAQELNRRWLGIEVSEDYCKQAAERINVEETTF